MGGERDAIVCAEEEAVDLGLAKDGGERFEGRRGEASGEIGGGEAVVRAEAEEESLFEHGLIGEAIDSGDEGGGNSGDPGEDGERWWWDRGSG